MHTIARSDATSDRGSPDYPHSTGSSPDSSDIDHDSMRTDQGASIVPAPDTEHDKPAIDQVTASTAEAITNVAPRNTGRPQHGGDDGNLHDKTLIMDADIPDEPEITFVDVDKPINSRGHCSDIYLGTHPTKGKLALKRLRRLGQSDADNAALQRIFCLEMTSWMRLRHEYILPCLGWFKRNDYLHFVSPFMGKGTLFDWIKLEVDGPQRLRLISELSEALAYVHSVNIVHGDVKAQNVLLSDDLHVQLCDFGLTKVAETRTNTRLKGAGSFRWQSPELWINEPKTFKSDVYAYAMTIVEILTGEVPFVELGENCAVMMAVVVQKSRPAKIPPMSCDGTSYATAWDVAEKGWHHDASERISMAKATELFAYDDRLVTLAA